MSPQPLTPSELARYARQLALPEFGEAGQLRLREASVLCIGAGGLGSPVAMHLAAAGVGRIGIVDPDRVERSNLHRQLLHGESGVGRMKTESAADRLRDINPHVQLDLYPVRFTPDNALGIADGYDLIVDGCDNFPTRFLSNDVAFLLGIPNVYGSIHRFEGQCTVFAPHLGGPCLRCMLPTLPPPDSVPGCAEAGVIGVLPGIVGCLQANEAIKLLAGIGDAAIGRLVHLDLLRFRFRELALRRDPGCRLCGGNPVIRSPDNPETRAAAACAGGAGVAGIDAADLRGLLDSGRFDGLLLDVRSPAERLMAAIAGSRLLPLGELESSLGSLDPRRETIIYCAHGVRSLAAARLLLANGFTRVAHLNGGIREWTSNGFPVERG